MPETEVRVTVRMPASMKEALEELARDQRRSLNATILTVLDLVADPTAPEPLLDEVARRTR